MERDTVIALARKSEGEEQQHGMWRMHVEDLERFAALVKEHLKSQGYRQCAKGQRTTQFCGMLDEAVKAEREECAKVAKQWDSNHPNTNYGGCIANLIRSRE